MTDEDVRADPEDDRSLWRALALFNGRSTLVHVSFLFGALVVWCGVAYAVFESGVVTTSPAATGATAQADRRLVGAVASFVVGGVLGVATLRSLGGPFLNFLLAGLYSMIGPSVLFPVAYGMLPAVYGPASDRFDPTALIPSVPGFVAFVIVGALYVRFVWTASDQERWLESIPDNPVIEPNDSD